MSDHTPANGERLVKSVERVRDLGEVFTPAATVAAMLDLIPAPMWEPHPSATFLEPACGDGNFLVAILQRKLDRIADAHASGTLPAGKDVAAIEFHYLEALSSIYAVDISADNVIGGTPGHELGARQRLLDLLADNLETLTGKRPTRRSVLHSCAEWIVKRNIQIGNMLEHNADGTPSGRDQLPLVEYQWDPTDKAVTMTTTTLGDVASECRQDAPSQLTMFEEPGPPVVTWTGVYRELRYAPIAEPVPSVLSARNGNSRR